MRTPRIARLTAIAAVLVVGTAWGPETEEAPCPITFTTAPGHDPVGPYSPSSGPYTDASWFLHNSSSSNVAISGTGCIKTGNVSSCTGNGFGAYVPALGQVDGDVTYSVGAGTADGTVQLTVTFVGPCGTRSGDDIDVIVN
jgi:hypothetical protein